MKTAGRLTAFIVLAEQFLGLSAQNSGKYIAYVGTYTGPNSKGIYSYRFDSATGSLVSAGLAAETPNPSFLVVHPNGQVLYAANETSNYQGQASGSVTSFSIHPGTGELILLNTVASLGRSPCHLAIDSSGKLLLVSNYNGGSLAAFPIRPDGSLGEATAFFQHSGAGANPRRQAGPHVHQAVFSPDNRFVLVADLGLDQVLVYRVDAAKGSLTPNDPPFVKLDPGSGPRHLAFSSNGKVVYVMTEIDDAVSAFSYDPATAGTKPLQRISTLPAGYTGSDAGCEIASSPTGRFLYASNCGDDSIELFSLDASTGLSKLEDHIPTQGKFPRFFTFDPSGAYLLAANQKSNNITIFRIHPETGKLSAAGSPVAAPAPVSVVFIPAP